MTEQEQQAKAQTVCETVHEILREAYPGGFEIAANSGCISLYVDLGNGDFVARKTLGAPRHITSKERGMIADAKEPRVPHVYRVPTMEA